MVDTLISCVKKTKTSSKTIKNTNNSLTENGRGAKNPDTTLTHPSSSETETGTCCHMGLTVI